MSKFGERLRQLRAEAKISQRALAQRIRMSKSSVSMFESGDREPGLETLEAIADTFNVDLDYLLGKSDIRNNYRYQGDFRRVAPQRHVPVLGTIPCGEPREAVQLSGETAPAPGEIACDYVFRAVGDSMIGAGIHDGDLVYIREQPEVENGQIAAVQLVEDGEFTSTLKRFYRDGSRVVLQPANPAYMPIVLTGEELDDVRIVGLAVYVLSNLV